MKKRKNIFLLFFISFAFIFLLNFISALSSFAVSISPTSGQAGQYQMYNVTINNTDSSKNITQVNLSGPLNSFTLSYVNTSTNATMNSTASTIEFINNSKSLISSGTAGYFWFNGTTTQAGSYNITVSTLDSSGNTNSTNVTVTISDVTPPFISFSSPTDGVTTSSPINYSYIQVNVTANDSGSGLNTIQINLYNSTSLVNYLMSSSSPFFYNITGLADGTYYLNATANDSAGNINSTSTITIVINTTVVNSTNTTCIPSWSCTWGSCVNGTQSQVCTDSNSCGVTTGEPNGTQVCVSSSNQACVTNWQCGDWTPSICSANGTQSRTCTDSNGCSQPEVQSRNCTLGNSLTTNTSQSASSGATSSSTIFFIIVVIIILGVVGLIFVLLRLKKKSAQLKSGNSNGYMTYNPRGPPPGPSFPAPQIPPQMSSQQAYQNNFKNY